MLGVGQRPIFADARRHPRARIAAPHSDNGIETLIGQTVQSLRPLASKIATTFGHESYSARVDCTRGIGTRRKCGSTVVAMQAREGHRHLAAASILHADKEHAGRLQPHAPLVQHDATSAFATGRPQYAAESSTASWLGAE